MSNQNDVDLRSDTVTRPTDAMRQAIAEASVADEVIDKDPTVDRLENRVADLLGKEEALFFPSGTQANQTAVRLHTRPGDEVVCEQHSHVYNYELSDASVLSGVQIRPVPSRRGEMEPVAVEEAIRFPDRHHAHTSLVCVENTHNMHGGAVVSLDWMRSVSDLADETDLPLHLDGARLWNAAAASGVSLEEYGDCADTVMVSLSKGLGCPIGSMLAFPGDRLEEAWAIRKRWGGGMRQVGVLAAAGLHALDNHRQRLAEDHERARRLAEGCSGIEGLRSPSPDTNIVMIDLEPGAPTAEELAGRLRERGVLVLPVGPKRIRAVTHLDVGDRGIDRAVEAFGDVVG